MGKRSGGGGGGHQAAPPPPLAPCRWAMSVSNGGQKACAAGVTRAFDTDQAHAVAGDGGVTHYGTRAQPCARSRTHAAALGRGPHGATERRALAARGLFSRGFARAALNLHLQGTRKG